MLHRGRARGLPRRRGRRRRSRAAAGVDPLELAATAGEDYELLFTAPAGARDAVERAADGGGLAGHLDRRASAAARARRRSGCLTKLVDPAACAAGTTCAGGSGAKRLLDELHDDRRRDTLRIDRVAVARRPAASASVCCLLSCAAVLTCRIRALIELADPVRPVSIDSASTVAAAYDWRPAAASAPQRRLGAAQRSRARVGHRAAHRDLHGGLGGRPRASATQRGSTPGCRPPATRAPRSRASRCRASASISA